MSSSPPQHLPLALPFLSPFPSHTSVALQLVHLLRSVIHRPSIFPFSQESRCCVLELARTVLDGKHRRAGWIRNVMSTVWHANPVQRMYKTTND